jgi:hypothetical protein
MLNRFTRFNYPSRNNPSGSITNAMLANMAQSTIKGRASGAGTGEPQDLNASQVRTILGLATTDSPTFAGLTSPLGNTDGTQNNARFTTPVATTITGSTTLGASHWGKRLIFNSASAITITLPQQSTLTTVAGVWFEYENINTGLVTFVKEGSETLTGNTTCAQNQAGKFFRDTTTDWFNFGATAIVNRPAWAQTTISISTSQTKYICKVQAPCTLNGIYHRCFSIGTAGTFKLQKNGSDITGLTGLVPTTSGSDVSITPISVARGDIISIVADGTLVSVTDLLISPDYTESF